TTVIRYAPERAASQEILEIVVYLKVHAQIVQDDIGDLSDVVRDTDNGPGFKTLFYGSEHAINAVYNLPRLADHEGYLDAHADEGAGCNDGLF
ncbi:hypothetical protein ACXWOG_09900, partial [Streptococcus pyogenes]